MERSGYTSIHPTPWRRCLQRGQGVFVASAVLLLLCGLLTGRALPQSTVLSNAQSLLTQHQPQQAIDLLLQHRHEVGDLQLRLALASAYTLLPDIENARKEFDQAIQLAPDRAETHRQYGRALMILADPAAARTELERAIVLDPSNGDSLYDLALLYARESQFASAATLLERATKLTKDRHSLFRNYTTVGQMYLLIRNWTAAREAFNHALALDRNALPDLVGLGTALVGLDLSSDAIPVLSKAVLLGPNDASAWEQLGRAESKGGDCQASAAAYSHTSSLEPGDRSLLNHLMQALRACGRKEEAAEVALRLKTIVDSEVALGVAGFDLQKINAEAMKMEQVGNYPAAEQNYRKLTTLDPDNPIFHRNLGLVLCRQSKWSEGLPELKRALLLDPDDVTSQRSIVAAESVVNAMHRNP